MLCREGRKNKERNCIVVFHTQDIRGENQLQEDDREGVVVIIQTYSSRRKDRG